MVFINICQNLQQLKLHLHLFLGVFDEMYLLIISCDDDKIELLAQSDATDFRTELKDLVQFDDFIIPNSYLPIFIACNCQQIAPS